MTVYTNNQVKRAVNATCKLYKSPTWNQRINSSTLVSFKWDPACLDKDTAYVTLKLLSSRGEVFRWEYLDSKAGNYDTQLDANWWDHGLQVPLQVAIIAQDEPVFLSPYPAGPIFTAVNSNPPASSLSATAATTASGGHTQSSVTVVPLSNFAGAGGAMNVASYISSQRAAHRGRIAAAVVVPLLLAIGLALGGYVFWSRRNASKRRQQWAENIDKRMSRVSSDWQSISAAGVRASMHAAAARERTKSEYSRHSGSMLGVAAAGSASDGRSPIYDRFNSGSRSSGLMREKGASSPDEYGNEKAAFATEDLTQLGPRARALSAAAAEGRPLSSLVKDNQSFVGDNTPTGAMGIARKRSKSTAADRVVPRPHLRTHSTASNNPYASAMSQRDSQAISIDGNSLKAFPTSSPDPRQRAESFGAPIPRNRNDSAATRARVGSRVSFADAPIPRPSGDRAPMPPQIRSSRAMSTAGDFAVDYDALPALALMRFKSNDGLDGVASTSGDGSLLTPTREFIPPMKGSQLASQQASGAGVSGRTPDEMLKAYAAAMAGEKGEYGQEMEMGSRRDAGGSEQGGVFASVRKFAERWRK